VETGKTAPVKGFPSRKRKAATGLLQGSCPRRYRGAMYYENTSRCRCDFNRTTARQRRTCWG